MKQVIANIVTKLYGIDGTQLFVKNKSRNISNIKQSIFYYLRYEFGFTHQKIGDIFNLGHSNVVIGIKSFECKLSVYSNERIAYEELKKTFKRYGLRDKELLSEFLTENEKYLSNDLKEYLRLRL